VRAGLPYWCKGGGFFEHMEIGDLVAYLRLTQDRSNSEALHRIINRPTRYLGKAFVEAVEANAPRYDGDLVKAIRFTDSYNNRKLSAKQRSSAMGLADLIESLTERDGEEISPAEAIMKVLNVTDYMDWLKQNTGMGGDGDDSRKDNIEALKKVCWEHPSIKSLLHFIDESSRLQQDSNDATQILTVHRSKGGEWDTVWVANMHDNSFPHKAAQLSGELMPERRIAYVAFTRAKNELKLAVPMVDEKGVQVFPSRFIAQAGIEQPDSSELVESAL
jgi:DNA helicase-2/ATP-dependent DNA helicase PcrA